MRIIEKLKRCNVFEARIKWIEKQKGKSIDEFFRQALKEGRHKDVNWAITKLLRKENKIRYAVFAAKQVVGIFEKKCPDKRPRLAIQAAEEYLKNPTQENRTIAYNAANDAYDAIYCDYDSVAATEAARSAYSAAFCAHISFFTYKYSEEDAATDAMFAAHHAVKSAYYAAYEDADNIQKAWTKMYTKILKYGLELLKQEGINEKEIH